MCGNLSAAIQCKTVSFDYHDPQHSADLNEFAKLHRLLAARFPLVHKHLTRTAINEHSLVFEWPGSDPSQKPWLAYAHLDVVPEGNASQWTHAPFSGVVANDASGRPCVWGRGAIDLKNLALGWMEVIEDLLRESKGAYRPRRS